MARKNKPIRSDIAWSTPDRIIVHGKSLPDEILGHLNLGDMAFLQILGRMPTPQESRSSAGGSGGRRRPAPRRSRRPGSSSRRSS